MVCTIESSGSIADIPWFAVLHQQSKESILQYDHIESSFAYWNDVITAHLFKIYNATGFCPFSSVRPTLEERADGTIIVMCSYYQSADASSFLWHWWMPLLCVGCWLYISIATMMMACSCVEFVLWHDMIEYCNLHSHKKPKQSHHTKTINNRKLLLWGWLIRVCFLFQQLYCSFLLVLDWSSAWLSSADVDVMVVYLHHRGAETWTLSNTIDSCGVELVMVAHTSSVVVRWSAVGHSVQPIIAIMFGVRR